MISAKKAVGRNENYYSNVGEYISDTLFSFYTFLYILSELDLVTSLRYVTSLRFVRLKITINKNIIIKSNPKIATTKTHFSGRLH